MRSYASTFTSATRATTPQFLLRLLGEIETPLVQLRDELEVGDVAFADPQDAVILFARANLAVRVANAGRSVIPVRAVAEQLDGHVSAKPVEIDEPETAGLVRAPPRAARSQSGSRDFARGADGCS